MTNPIDMTHPTAEELKWLDIGSRNALEAVQRFVAGRLNINRDAFPDPKADLTQWEADVDQRLFALEEAEQSALRDPPTTDDGRRAQREASDEEWERTQPDCFPVDNFGVVRGDVTKCARMDLISRTDALEVELEKTRDELLKEVVVNGARHDEITKLQRALAKSNNIEINQKGIITSLLKAQSTADKANRDLLNKEQIEAMKSQSIADQSLRLAETRLKKAEEWESHAAGLEGQLTSLRIALDDIIYAWGVPDDIKAAGGSKAINDAERLGALWDMQRQARMTTDEA